MKNIILFFSKTDLSVYEHCSAYSKGIQLSLGVFVILTGILALFSGTFAVTNLFTEFDWELNKINFSAFGYIASPIIGLVYAMMIISIDREVVSATSKTAVLLRIPLAIVIGLVVAVPIELKLLEGRIEKQLIKEYKDENNGVYMAKQTSLQELKSKKTNLENQIQNYQDNVNQWSETMEHETVGRVKNLTTGVKGQGPAYHEAERNMKLHIANRDIALKNLSNFMKYEYGQGKKTINDQYNSQQIPQQFDLMSKYQALARLKKSDTTGATGSMSMGITLLFLLFELIPSLIKVFTPITEYDAILEARRRLNVQLAHVVANEGMAELNSGDIDVTFQIIDEKKKETKRSPLYYINEIKRRIIID